MSTVAGLCRCSPPRCRRRGGAIAGYSSSCHPCTPAAARARVGRGPAGRSSCRCRCRIRIPARTLHVATNTAVQGHKAAGAAHGPDPVRWDPALSSTPLPRHSQAGAHSPPAAPPVWRPHPCPATQVPHMDLRVAIAHSRPIVSLVICSERAQQGAGGVFLGPERLRTSVLGTVPPAGRSSLWRSAWGCLEAAWLCSVALHRASAP